MAPEQTVALVAQEVQSLSLLLPVEPVVPLGQHLLVLVVTETLVPVLLDPLQSLPAQEAGAVLAVLQAARVLLVGRRLFT